MNQALSKTAQIKSQNYSPNLPMYHIMSHILMCVLAPQPTLDI